MVRYFWGETRPITPRSEIPQFRGGIVRSAKSPGVFEIADLDSHNGTFVNGTKVNRKIVGHGDRFRIGSSEFVFLTGTDDASLTQAGRPVTDSHLKTVTLGASACPKILQA